MTSLNQIAELILKRYYGGEIVDDAKITKRQVMLHVLAVRDNLVRQDLFESMKTGDKEVDPAFITTYDSLLPVFDSAKDVYYLTLPSKPASLPNDLGVFNIRPMKGHTATNKTEYVRIANGSWSLVPSYLEGLVGWVYKGNKRVEFPNMDNQQAQTQLIVEMISEHLPEDADAPLYVPSHYHETIIARVLQLLGAGGRPDTVNNDN